MYAAHNIGREGWCLLTADSHTLLHVLRKHKMYTTHLWGRRSCESDCKDRQYYLVPRTRPSSILGRIYVQHDFVYTQGDAEMILEESKQVRHLFKRGVLDYLRKMNIETGYCVLTGLDFEDGKHRAVWRVSWDDPVVVVVREAQDTRQFLM